MRPVTGLLSVCAVAALAPAPAPATTYYVDVLGLGGEAADENPGTRARPWLTPLHAFSVAQPGDTIVFRAGVYRLPRTVHTSDLAASGGKPLTLTVLPGERATITNLRPIAAAEWTPVPHPDAVAVFSAPASKGFRVSNVVEDGVPLRRAPSGDPNDLEDTPPGTITAPGQWCSSIREGRVWVATSDGQPPGDRIAICDVGGFGASGNLFALTPREDGRDGPNLVLDGLTIETGFHGLLIRTGSVALRGCELRKSYGDLLNSACGRLQVESCELHHFGESAIDITGAPAASPPRPLQRTAIRGCTFRDSVLLRSAGQKGVNAVMLKGGSEDVVVEGCIFRDMETSYGALTLGGATSGGIAREGVRLIARNSIFQRITGPWVVLFAGSEDCVFANNLVIDSQVREIVHISRARRDDAQTLNVRPRLLNNILFGNAVADAVVSIGEGAATDAQIDFNLIVDSGARFVIDGTPAELVELPARGCQAHGIGRAPLFRDARAGDFRPAADSPVIDAGMALHALVPDDFDGVARRQGAGWEIGPFEFVPAR
ncbi:MAG: choice-of-anchor Q domain-containing protein [Armatimonadota bacterium]